jgi:hypothetical protein
VPSTCRWHCWHTTYLAGGRGHERVDPQQQQALVRVCSRAGHGSVMYVTKAGSVQEQGRGRRRRRKRRERRESRGR